MRAAVITYPGSNCDRDMAVALKQAGFTVEMVWHKNNQLNPVDLVALPGGFSFGDYLRAGAIAAHSPITRAVIAHAERGGFVLGVCNGFQVLTEAKLLPGALLRNADLKYICRTVPLKVEANESAYLARYTRGAEISLPVAHHDGNFSADEATLDQIEAEGRVAFRYVERVNGAARNIAGVLSENRRVLGMMPHPERAADARLGNTDGAALFAGLAEGLVSA